jgi:hypothetical protein
VHLYLVAWPVEPLAPGVTTGPRWTSRNRNLHGDVVAGDVAPVAVAALGLQAV